MGLGAVGPGGHKHHTWSREGPSTILVVARASCAWVHGRDARVTSSNPPKSAPTVAIMPFDHDVARADFFPPGGEFRARNVERSRRHQMIEDDRVLLSPAKSRNRAQVIVVEKMSGQRLAAR